MTETAAKAIRAGPHEFVAPAQGTRNAEFGWCVREDCGFTADASVHASEEERRKFDSQRDDIDTRRIGAVNHWHGYLTAANAEAVAARIRETLKRRLYSYVNTWRGDGEPELRVSQKLQRVTVTPYEDRDGAMITVSDTYGLWFIESRLADRKAANEVSVRSGELGREAHFLVFDGERLNMRYWNDASERMVHVVVAPEYPDRLSDDYA